MNLSLDALARFDFMSPSSHQAFAYLRLVQRFLVIGTGLEEAEKRCVTRTLEILGCGLALTQQEFSARPIVTALGVMGAMRSRSLTLPSSATDEAILRDALAIDTGATDLERDPHVFDGFKIRLDRELLAAFAGMIARQDGNLSGFLDAAAFAARSLKRDDTPSALNSYRAMMRHIEAAISA